MEYDHEGQVFHFISGLLVGAVLGAGVALMTVPTDRKSRRKLNRTRKQIRKAATGIRDSATDRWDDIADEVKGRVDDALDVARKRFS